MNAFLEAATLLKRFYATQIDLPQKRKEIVPISMGLLRQHYRLIALHVPNFVLGRKDQQSLRQDLR
ncbi:MAG TPA: hypothetical protein DE036_00065 [Actinobacteria bacterium]|nr:hypothetical protein [Actinomycetota bacterium]